MINRRRLLELGGLGLTVAGAIGASRFLAANEAQTEDNLGYHMPPESAPHERTFMQWPASVAAYGKADLEAVQGAIVALANAIAEFEPVVMLGAAGRSDHHLHRLDPDIERWDIPTDDLWCRDSGPTFVLGPSGQLAIAHLRFNGWGNKQSHPNDGLIAQRVAQRLGLPLLESGLVGEQGGMEHDGAGTILAHASSWVNPNRNNLSQAEIGKRLLSALGGTNMIWAPGVKDADITDYHIDALARFVGPGHVLIQIDEEEDPDDPWSRAAHQTYAVLKQAHDARGKPLRITTLPEAGSVRSRRSDFVASYINYYVCNGAVVAAQFGDRRSDETARATLQELYPDRKVVMLNVDPIGESGGGIHCATQQQPKI